MLIIKELVRKKFPTLNGGVGLLADLWGNHHFSFPTDPRLPVQQGVIETGIELFMNLSIELL